MIERKERCDKCKWWDKMDDEGEDSTGFCLRYPPTISDAQLTMLSLFLASHPDWQVRWEQSLEEVRTLSVSNWPVTVAQHFCGEFTSKPIPNG